MLNSNSSLINGGETLTIVLVLFVAWCVSSFTLEDALGCFSTFSGARGSAAIHMVLAGGDGVGTTTCTQKQTFRIENTTNVYHSRSLSHRKLTDMGIIEASRDQPIFGPEVPGS